MMFYYLSRVKKRLFSVLRSFHTEIVLCFPWPPHVFAATALHCISSFFFSGYPLQPSWQNFLEILYPKRAYQIMKGSLGPRLPEFNVLLALVGLPPIPDFSSFSLRFLFRGALPQSIPPCSMKFLSSRSLLPAVLRALLNISAP